MLLGPLLAVASSMAWGTADFLGGLLSRRARPLAVVGGSQTVGLVVVSALAAALGLLGPGGPGIGPWLGWGVACAASGTSGLVLFYLALARGRMGVVSPVAACGAVVPVLLAAAAGERPSGLQVAGVVLALAGAVGASGPEVRRRGAGRHDALDGDGGDAGAGGGALPVLLAAASGLGFGLLLWFLARGAESSAVLTLLTMRVTGVVVIGAVALAVRSVGGLSVRQLPLLVACGVLDSTGNLLLAHATTLQLVSVATVLGSLYPVATVLLARWVLHERMARVQLVGVGAALAGVALLAAA